MSEIADLPEHFLKRHEDWHMANHDIQRPGFGVGLLDFHRDLLGDVLGWMRDTGHDTGAVQPWAAIPVELVLQRHLVMFDALSLVVASAGAGLVQTSPV